MDTKEKLLDVLSEAWEKRKEFCVPHDECETCPYDKYPKNCHMYIVFDHLIANGVTVQDRLVPKCVVISEKYGSPRCPSCNAILRGRSSHYCWQCGQKVRWYPPDPKGE